MKKTASKAKKKSTDVLPPEERCDASEFEMPKCPSVDKLQKQIDKMFAKAKLAKEQAALVDPALLLVPRRALADGSDTMKVGATKLGGLPDLPPGSKWPEHEGVPLTFVGQLRLEDVAKQGESRLPKTGLLSFFVADEGDSYCEKAVVLHTKDAAKVARLEVPATFQIRRGGRPARRVLAACAVTFKKTLTVPSSSNPAVTEHLGDDAQERYSEHVNLEPDDVLCQLLGFRYHGYDAENSDDNRLLLRVTSDAQLDSTFGDDDPLDFYIPKKDLAAGKFDRVYPYMGD